MSGKKTLHLVSLGCAKNLVDSEVILAILENNGYFPVDDPAKAELLLVNTCGFIQPAVEEAVDEILRLAEYKQHGNNKMLVVAGCLVQRYGLQLLKELPEVDLFVGINEIPEIGELIRQHHSLKEPGVLMRQPVRFLMGAATPRHISTPSYQAFLKITDGCNNRCSYCLIPSIRGRLRSRSVHDLILEAQQLENGGVRELNLIAQDLTAYGDDLPGSHDLVFLLRRLLSETNIPWIRLLYLYPSTTSEELLALMAENTRIVPYLDLPFQHVSSRILKRMNRNYTLDDLEELLEKIRRHLPYCAIRSTMLVGFPGEREADVDLLLACLRRWRLDHVGVFQYHDEMDCAAHRLDEKVDTETKEKRYSRVMQAQAEVSAHNAQQYVGRVESVLVEGVSPETELLLIGRTRFQAPEIDGCVYIADGQANPGDFVSVAVTEAHTYDLVGNIVS